MNGPLPPGLGLPSGVKGPSSLDGSGSADLDLARRFGAFTLGLSVGFFLPLDRPTYRDGAIECASPCLRRRYSTHARISSYALIKSVKAACRSRTVSVAVSGAFLCSSAAVSRWSARTSAWSSSSSATDDRFETVTQLLFRNLC
jgi:hypothetical protein